MTRYGFSDKLGLVSYDDSSEVFIGRDFEKTQNYSEGTAELIDGEVRRILDECHEKAKEIILEHRDVLDACAELLLEKEKISREEFEELFENRN